MGGSVRKGAVHRTAYRILPAHCTARRRTGNTGLPAAEGRVEPWRAALRQVRKQAAAGGGARAAQWAGPQAAGQLPGMVYKMWRPPRKMRFGMLCGWKTAWPKPPERRRETDQARARPHKRWRPAAAPFRAGVNGAGKTTALECIEGLRRQDGGSAVVWGKAGIQLQSASLPAHIRPMEAVALFAKWNGTKPDAAMLDALGIGGMKKTQYGALSTGQKRRLHLALALTGRPDVVFLDEPTAGLDVEGRVALHAQIRALQAQGKTIVLASHDMAEVESLCSRIGILNRGELVFLGTVTELTAHIGSRYLVCVRTAQGEERFEADDVGEALLPLLEAYKRCGVAVLDVTVGRGTLEQHFMDIAKEDV